MAIAKYGKPKAGGVVQYKGGPKQVMFRGPVPPKQKAPPKQQPARQQHRAGVIARNQTQQQPYVDDDDFVTDAERRMAFYKQNAARPGAAKPGTLADYYAQVQQTGVVPGLYPAQVPIAPAGTGDMWDYAAFARQQGIPGVFPGMVNMPQMTSMPAGPQPFRGYVNPNPVRGNPMGPLRDQHRLNVLARNYSPAQPGGGGNGPNTAQGSAYSGGGYGYPSYGYGSGGGGGYTYQAPIPDIPEWLYGLVSWRYRGG